MPALHFIETLLDRPIAFHRIFAELTKSALAGLMLSQAIYWSRRTKDEAGWFYKSREEWFAELYMSRREQEAARACLRASKDPLPTYWYEERRGLPARIYYRLDFDALHQHLLTLHNEAAQDRLTDDPVTPVSATISQFDNSEGVPSSWAETYQLEGRKRTNWKGGNVPSINTETTAETTSSRRRARAPQAAAAALSKFAEIFILDYLAEMKPKNQERNPGLAHKLWLTGEDDHLIERWSSKRAPVPPLDTYEELSAEEAAYLKTKGLA